MSWENRVTLGDGKTLTVAGVGNVIVPELAFGQIRKLQKDGTMARLANNDLSEDERLDAMYDIVLLAVKRHYPDATKEDLESGFTLAQLQDAVAMAVKLEVRKPGDPMVAA